jgi:beta-lactam-binding protein with PASTA domain
MSRKIGCLAGVLVFVAIGFAACTAMVEGDTPVPDVTGATRDQAEMLLQREGLRIGSVKFDEDARVTPGYVISQRPGPGANTVANGKVHIVISGPDLVMLPQIVGRDENEAKEALEEAGLRRGGVVRQHDDYIPEGVVIDAEPTDELWVPRLTKIAMVVSLGPDSAPVPGLQGMWDEDAKEFIYDLGFDPDIRREYGRYAEGIVVDQFPSAGTDTELGEGVEIVVSKGAPPVDIPDVTGLTVAEATTAMRTAGLVVQEERMRVKDFAWSEPIIGSQYPHAGSAVPQGSAVMLTVWVD